MEEPGLDPGLSTPVLLLSGKGLGTGKPQEGSLAVLGPGTTSILIIITVTSYLKYSSSLCTSKRPKRYMDSYLHFRGGEKPRSKMSKWLALGTAAGKQSDVTPSCV
jgi:hypothetical protein